MTTQNEKQADMSTSKEKLHSPKNVPCSICLDAVESAGDRSIARLKCGHHFHLDCIGSAFNAKGAMQCPNCRQVEGGQWLFSSGCYLQQQLSRNSNSDEDHTYAGMLYNLYHEPLSHPSRRTPHGAYHQIAVESEYPTSTNRWRAEVPSRNDRLNEIARPIASDLNSSVGMYMHRAPRHGSVLPTPHMLEDPMPRQRMDEDGYLYYHEPARSHTYVTNRGPSDGDREIALSLVPLPNVGNRERPMAVSRFQDARYVQIGGVAYNTRRGGAYTSRTPSGHEWGSSHDSVRRVLANPYSGEVHHAHPLNRAGNSHSYYDGQHVGARAPWL